MHTPANDLIFYFPEGHAAHAEPGHPERPERVEILRQALLAGGWWQRYAKLTPLEIPEDVLQEVHSKFYLQALQDACRQGRRLDMDTYVTPASWSLALAVAGGAAAVADAIWRGAARRGLALTRPPGHHATRERGMGFCLLNNIAIAAQYLQMKSGARKLAIVDLDLHHGNGTQDIFWERGDVFYISTHQSPLYPGSGSLEETGGGPGLDCTANFPLPPGSGDEAFAGFMEGLILPLLDRYSPEMLLVSFGFDPHWKDPLGLLQLSAGGYGEIISALTAWADARCNGRIGLFLEGGYDLAAAAACGSAVTAALLGERWTDTLGVSPRAEGRSWEAVHRRAREIWGL